MADATQGGAPRDAAAGSAPDWSDRQTIIDRLYPDADQGDQGQPDPATATVELEPGSGWPGWSAADDAEPGDEDHAKVGDNEHEEAGDADEELAADPDEGDNTEEGESTSTRSPEFEFEGLEQHEGLRAAYSDVARGLGLTQEQAADAVARVQQAQHAELDAMRDGWVEQIEQSPDLNRGRGLAENLKLAGSVIREHGSPELVQFLDESGAGDHPELVRFVSRVAKRLRQLEARELRAFTGGRP